MTNLDNSGFFDKTRPRRSYDQLYTIKRTYHPSLNKSSEIIKEHLTLEEAREHCNDPSTANEGYFDGYFRE